MAKNAKRLLCSQRIENETISNEIFQYKDSMLRADDFLKVNNEKNWTEWGPREQRFKILLMPGREKNAEYLLSKCWKLQKIV